MNFYPTSLSEFFDNLSEPKPTKPPPTVLLSSTTSKRAFPDYLGTRKPKIHKCWICGLEGHKKSQCPQRRPFSFTSYRSSTGPNYPPPPVYRPAAERDS